MIWWGMAKKKKTPEQLAVAEALKRPERRWNVNRNCAWVWAPKWGLFTNYKGFSFSQGEAKPKFHGPEVPEPAINVSLDLWPFRFLVFWKTRRLVWIQPFRHRRTTWLGG